MAGSAGKAGAGLLGKTSSSIGKSSGMASSAKSTNIMGSSAKSNKFMGSSSGGYSQKTSSYISSSPKNNSLLVSAAVSPKIMPATIKNTNIEKSSYSPSASAKTGSFFGGYNARSDNITGSSGKSKVRTEKSSFPVPPKSSNILSPCDKSNKSSAFSGKHTLDASKDYPSFISPQNNKSQTSIGIIWIPSRKRNKKKEMAFSSHNYDHYHEKSPSMYSYMSGDSPSYHQPLKKKEEETDLLVPKVTTAAAVNTGIAAATIDVPLDNSGASNAEEKQEFMKQNSEDSKEAAGDTHEQGNKNERNDSDYLENNDNIAKSQNKWDQDKQGDKVDSVFLRPPPPHKARSAASTNDDEDCGIKCLYYTLQCCDCVLM